MRADSPQPDPAHDRNTMGEPAGLEARRARAFAELLALRVRIAELEVELEGIRTSPTFRLATQLRGIKRGMAELGPVGRPIAGAVRLGQIALNEGPAGLVERARHRLPYWLGGSGLVGPFRKRPPRRLPPMAIRPMREGSGPTIVIPVFNKAVLTYQCLKSLIEHTAPGSYEVIVVDNASDDETPRLLAHVEGLRVIRNSENLGFVDACNQGAAEAAGEAILFLNNDTMVFPGWLPPLVDTLADPTVGAVGGQLIYPTGRLQEAGGIIWNDGTGWNYGRDDERDRPEYQYAREVDYCSGACLLVRRRLFAELGGFDRRFAPAYYEDTDLCFELRRLGYRVVYQPRARVLHLEGATAGTDPSSGFKRFQEINRAKFVDKHALALAAQHPPDPARVFRARDRRPGLRILLIDHMVPLYDRDSGSVRMLALLRLFGSLGHAVTFLPDNLTDLQPYTDTLQREGVEVVYGKIWMADYIARRLADFDLVIMCRISVASRHLAEVTAPGHPPLIFDTIDLHFLREQRGAALLDDPVAARAAAVTRSAELAVARASDQVWVVSDHEAAVLQAEDPALVVSVIPNIHEIREAVPPFAARRDLLFVGGFQHPPNQDAVAYFVGQVLPLIRPRLPGVRLVVVGPDVPAAVQGLAAPDVVIAGHVPEIEPVFDRSRVLVAPLRYGAGLKGKIGQSLAYGLPLVTTSVGAEGMDLVDGRHALIADAPAAFADAVVRLYGDAALWTTLQDEGRRHVDARFGPAAVKERLAAALAAVARPHPAS